jgi:glycosyltransferase involved in cell wall biosynthesis
MTGREREAPPPAHKNAAEVAAIEAGSIRVLYLTYWGALEPLGQSLVVPAVSRLAQLGVAMTLVTFEKAGDLSKPEMVRKQLADFAGVGVKWHPLRYHKRPKWPATLFDGAMAVVQALRLRLRGPFDIVHARTFVAGPMGYVIAKLLNAVFVYHNEGFYPDEQVDGGVWRKESFIHRGARAVETFLYERADGLIALSDRACSSLESRLMKLGLKTPIIRVPSAVDLDAFRPASIRPPRSSRSLSLVYLGSVGLRYRLDDAGRFVAALRKLHPDTTLSVVSRADRGLVTSMLDEAGLPREAWTLKELTHSDVPAELQRHDAGLFFLTEGLSEHGCSPTKIGEYWASGLPVVTTPNVSDTDAIVQDQRVGVVVHPGRSNCFDTAAHELLDLLEDPLLEERCRQAAEGSYSLEASCVRQVNLYRKLAS